MSGAKKKLLSSLQILTAHCDNN